MHCNGKFSGGCLLFIAISGSVDASHSSVRDPSRLMAVSSGVYRSLDVQLADCYGNNCRTADPSQLTLEVFTQVCPFYD